MYTTEENVEDFVGATLYNVKGELWEIMGFDRTHGGDICIFEVWYTNIKTREEYTTIGATFNFCTIEVFRLANHITEDEYKICIAQLRKLREMRDGTEPPN